MRLFITSLLTILFAIGLCSPVWATGTPATEEQDFTDALGSIITASTKILTEGKIDLVDLNNTTGYPEARAKTAKLLEQVNALSLPEEYPAFWGTMQFAVAGMISSTLDELDIKNSLEERTKAISNITMFGDITLMLLQHEEEFKKDGPYVPISSICARTIEEEDFMDALNSIITASDKIITEANVDWVDLNNTTGYPEIQTKTAKLLKQVNALNLPVDHRAFWETMRFAVAGMMSGVIDEFDIKHSLEERAQATDNEVIFGEIGFMLLQHEGELKEI